MAALSGDRLFIWGDDAAINLVCCVGRRILVVDRSLCRIQYLKAVESQVLEVWPVSRVAPPATPVADGLPIEAI